MPKQDKLNKAMQTRTPFAPIVPVDILQIAEKPFAEPERKEVTEKQSAEPERKKNTPKPSGSTVRKHRVDKTSTIIARKKRTRKVSGRSKRLVRSALERAKRETVRDSYEAYSDHLALIAELQTLYTERTGAFLSKSRVIREALEWFLPQALSVYEQE